MEKHSFKGKKFSLEEKLKSYKNRMELIRTIIGIIVLGIQIIIVFHLSK